MGGWSYCWFGGGGAAGEPEGGGPPEFGGDAGEGIAGELMLSRASGIWAASGAGVEGSIGSRYGSTSPYDSGEVGWLPDGRGRRPRRKGRRRSLMQLWCGWRRKVLLEWLSGTAGKTHANTGTRLCSNGAPPGTALVQEWYYQSVQMSSNG